MQGEVKHECGIAAVSIDESSEESKKTLFYLYRLLLNLQHRGQLSAGITTFNKERAKILDTYKDLGPVNEVFKTSSKAKSIDIFKRYLGQRGIGHVRYATCGSEERSLAQPFERHHGRKWKWFSFCFNGNICNYMDLKKSLMEKTDYHVVHDLDTEIIMHHIARGLRGNKNPDMENIFAEISEQFDGCYNIAYMNAFGEMSIVRDPNGFRPLCYGKSDGKFMAASESNALLNCNITKHKPLKPGEMISIDKNGSVEIKKYAKSKVTSHCMFEWVYFSSVSSVLDDRSVYITRTNLGKELAKLETEKLTKDHIVVPVPDTAKASGDSMAYELGIPSKEGLVRNRFVGRTFIEGTSRKDRVQNKYTALKEILGGKKILLVDDSMVRGTTTKQLVRYIKEEGGAKEVHLRISCPPIRGPCFYGIDMSTVGELLVPPYEGMPVAEDISPEICEKIAKDVGADSLIYQTQKGLVRSIGLPKEDLCMACINGKYPTECGKAMFKQAWDNFYKGKKGRTYSCNCHR